MTTRVTRAPITPATGLETPLSEESLDLVDAPSPPEVVELAAQAPLELPQRVHQCLVSVMANLFMPALKSFQEREFLSWPKRGNGLSSLLAAVPLAKKKRTLMSSAVGLAAELVVYSSKVMEEA